MERPPNNHSHLWNDMPKEDRERLMPHMMEIQMQHIWQCKHKAISAHKKHMKELDEWMASIEREYLRLKRLGPQP